MKAIEIRMCIVTRKREHKKDLLKFNIINEKLHWDKNNEIKSRSFYITKDLEIINRAKTKKIISKKFKVEFTEEVYLEVIKEMSKKDEVL